jgi:hypothetical protein
MTEAEEIAAKAVSLAREVIQKYGADADKPSVHLATALINGAHERDRLRTELKETQLVVTRMLPWQKLSDAQEGMVERLTKERDEARAQRDELESIKHAEERPIRTELRLLKAERNDLKAQLDELIEATILGWLKSKTAHDEIVSLRAELAQLRKAMPGCLGEWTGGSGGHRKYTGGCKSPGVWNVGLGFVCDQHKNTNGGDDDAWTWESERELLMSLASPDQDGIERAAERLLLLTAQLTQLTADRDGLSRFVLAEYARGVEDGSNINVNILEESKADLEEQRQEIGRLRAEAERMRPVYETAAACPITSSDGWLMCQLRAGHGGNCEMKDISLAKEKP